MKHKHFYNHLVSSTDITVEIAELDITSKERIELLSLVDANIHSSVISSVLSSLPSEDKKIFLHNLSNKDHKKTWLHLNEKIDDAEIKIRKIIQDTIKELVEDVKNSKDKSD